MRKKPGLVASTPPYLAPIPTPRLGVPDAIECEMLSSDPLLKYALFVDESIMPAPIKKESMTGSDAV